MGLGGYLTWTALSREVYEKHGIKCLPVEVRGSAIKMIKSETFVNNPTIVQDFTEDAVLPIYLNEISANYCIRDTPEKAYHRSDRHIIETICDNYQIKNPKLKCEIYLTKEEEAVISRLVSELPSSFITIEPNSKDNYTPNRVYPFEKWQNVVDKLKSEIPVVQIGTSRRLLEGVIDMTGKTTFREACGLIGKSRLFLSSEGGLVHGATAFDTKSIVVITGYQTKKMVGYPNNVNIDISSHGPCGLKIPCPECTKDAKEHNPEEIWEAARNILNTPNTPSVP